MSHRGRDKELPDCIGKRSGFSRVMLAVAVAPAAAIYLASFHLTRRFADFEGVEVAPLS